MPVVGSWTDRTHQDTGQTQVHSNPTGGHANDRPAANEVVPVGTKCLVVSELRKQFGGLVALDDVSVDFEAEAVTAIIGPNGAGKTTFYNILSGLEKASAGRVTLFGQDITGWSATKRARNGMARTFQNNRLYPKSTVLENVLTACHDRAPWDAVTQTEMAWEQLEVVGLAGDAQKRAGELSIGMQRQLELARALARDPKVLLLDEPAAGLSAERIDSLMELVAGLTAKGKTVLLIEHRMRVVRDIAKSVVVLDRGQVIAHGGPSEVMASEEVKRAYVGQR